ncbi:MAG: YbaB/EbfC family nucleoid-associated protein [bacterium]
MFDLKKIQKMQQELQSKMETMQKELATKTVEATSGGGVVTAVVNGNQELVQLKIQPEAVDPSDLEMLEDLVVAAVNAAMEKAKTMSQESLSKITGGFKLPGFPF